MPTRIQLALEVEENPVIAGEMQLLALTSTEAHDSPTCLGGVEAPASDRIVGYVPEPSAALSLLAGGTLLALLGRRR